MKVPIEPMTFAESNYRRGGKYWNASTLYKFAQEKGYPVMEMPLWCVDLSEMPFECNNMSDFIFQCSRLRKCSLKYPIILDDYGQIADGCHRICKAILQGK